MSGWVSQLRKGVTELVVLAALAEGEAYGYQLLQRINRMEGLGMTESTVYPLLARLRRDQLVNVRAAASSAGPPRRYYTLTTAGRSRLAEMSREWQSVATAVEELLKENRK